MLDKRAYSGAIYDIIKFNDQSKEHAVFFGVRIVELNASFLEAGTPHQKG